MDSPKISVIVPVYNVEQYLPRCIDSILAQTFTDFELLLIDDGSRDNSGKICDEYAEKDSRIRVFHKENGGVSSARNVGLDNTCGEYVSFIDSDDWIGPSFLQELITGQADLIIGGKVNVGYKTGETRYKPNLYIKNDISECLQKVLLDDLFRVPWGKLYRKRIIDVHKLRFDSYMKIAEDTAFVQSFLFYCDVLQFVDSCSYFYNVQVTSKYKLTSEGLLYTHEKLIGIYNQLAARFIFTNESYVRFVNSYLVTLYLKWIECNSFTWKGYQNFKYTLKNIQISPLLDSKNYPRITNYIIKMLESHHYLIGYAITCLISKALKN